MTKVEGEFDYERYEENTKRNESTDCTSCSFPFEKRCAVDTTVCRFPGSHTQLRMQRRKEVEG